MKLLAIVMALGFGSAQGQVPTLQFQADMTYPVLSGYLLRDGVSEQNRFYHERGSLSVRFRPCVASWLCFSGGYVVANDNALRFNQAGSVFRHRALGVEVKAGPVWVLPSLFRSDQTFPGRADGYYGALGLGVRWDAAPGVFMLLERVVGLMDMADKPTIGVKRTLVRVSGPIGSTPLRVMYQAIENAALPGQPKFHFWTGTLEASWYPSGPVVIVGDRPVVSPRDQLHNEALSFLAVGWRFTLAH